LIGTSGISGNVELHHQSREEREDTGISEKLVVSTDGSGLASRWGTSTTRVDVSTMDGTIRSSERNTGKSGGVRWVGNVRGVGRRSLMTTFARTTLGSITIASLTEVSQSSGRDFLRHVRESSRRIQKVDGRKAISAELVVSVVGTLVGCNQGGTSVTKSTTHSVRKTMRERRSSKAIGVLLATTNVDCVTGQVCFGRR
jgi:hypothetical protein